jgi:hypothetical protein
MRRFLPNGWQYQNSIMMYLMPDGSSLDGTGHIPAVQIRNSTFDIQNNNDLVFEKSVAYLFDKYGIEYTPKFFQLLDWATFILYPN